MGERGKESQLFEFIELIKSLLACANKLALLIKIPQVKISATVKYSLSLKGEEKRLKRENQERYKLFKISLLSLSLKVVSRVLCQTPF